MLSQKAWDSAQRIGSTRHIENIRAAAMFARMDGMTNAWKPCRPTGIVTHPSVIFGRKATLTTAGGKYSKKL
jgi:hypothetical protein